MKNKKVLIGLAVLIIVALATVFYYSDSSLFEGRFNFRGQRTTEDFTKSGKTSGKIATDSGVDTLMSMETYDARTPSSDAHEGYDLIGVWVIQYEDDATLCYDFDFGLINDGGPMDWSDAFDDLRLNAGSDEIEIAEQIEDGYYSSVAMNGNTGAQGSGGLSSSKNAYYFKLFGELNSSASSSLVANPYAYITATCVKDSDGTKYVWDSYDSDGENAYFETDAFSVGYGISGGIDLSSL